MVCHLSGTAGLGAQSRKTVKDCLAWQERDRRGEIKWEDRGVDEWGIPIRRPARAEDYPPKERLADTKELFKRLYDVSKRHETAGAVLEIDESERDAFRRLHDLRNDLTHFTPKGWLIEIAGLPQIFLNVLAVLEKIAGDSWPFRHLNPEEVELLKSLMGRLRTQLHSMV